MSAHKHRWDYIAYRTEGCRCGMRREVEHYGGLPCSQCGRGTGVAISAAAEIRGQLWCAACGVKDAEKRRRAASGTSGSAQDAQRLDPKGAGPAPAGGDAQPSGPNDTPLIEGDAQ